MSNIRCLGKLAPRIDRRTLRMTQFVPIIPPPPPAADWTGAVEVPWKDLMNATIGLCTGAAALHLDMTWTANASTVFVPTDQQSVAEYSALTGYDPKDPNSDTGAVELNVLNRWRTVGIAGRKIIGFMSIDPHRSEER